MDRLTSNDRADADEKQNVNDERPETPSPSSLIRRLDPVTVNQIAAGEVIERPSSVAKELIDNALDAGASVIHIALESGGIRFLSCTDDGSGMSPEDARMALQNHATSKLRAIGDLSSISTLGFRGEALPSIASVARLELRTRALGAEEGTRVVVEGGKVKETGPWGTREGTTVICRDLFFNTPARYKFLKKDSVEAGAVAEIVGHAALARPDVSFRLTETGEKQRELLHTPGNGDLLSAIHAVFGKETADTMIPVTSPEGAPIRVDGYVTKPEGGRGNRSKQVFIVNGRVIQSGTLRAAADEASKTWFMKGRFPQLVLNLAIAPNAVDVNVHPQKLDVRFRDNRAVFQAVYRALRNAFEKQSGIVTPPEARHRPARGEVEGRAAENPLQKSDLFSTRRLRQDTTAKTAAGPDLSFELSDRQIAYTDLGKPQAPSLPPVEGRRTTAPPRPEPPVKQPSSAREEGPSEPLKVHVLRDARLIGTLFDTYILLEDPVRREFLVVDQHAAHERVLYEKLLARHRGSEGDRPASQLLLVPVRVDVREGERALLQDEKAWLSGLGFDYEPFGERSVVLRAVPDAGKGPYSGLNPEDALRAALDALDDAEKTGALPDDTLVFYDMACKAAVKAHDRLSEDEIRLLLEQLMSLENPYHCPHGRPVILRYSQTAIEKKFGRIV